MDTTFHNPSMPKIDSQSSLNSRQKSCNACVRGKRRCDKRSPRCTRCATKGLDCVYHKMPPFQQEHHPSADSSMTGGSTTPEMTDVPEFDINFEMESLGTETSPESHCQQSMPPPQHHQQQQHHQHHAGVDLAGLDFDIGDFMNSNTGPGGLFNMGGVFGEGKLDIPPLPVAPVAPPQDEPKPIRDVSLLRSKESMCLSIDPLDIHDKRSWMAHTLEHITNFHKAFAKTRALPFMHERLWATRLPKTILTVFSAATAYANRSGDNKGWVMKLLSDTAMALHRDGESATSNLDKLARVQALLILDSIRVFDGDIALRAAAEREAPVLVKWFQELHLVRNELEAEAAQFVGGGSVRSRDKPPRDWDSWVVLESTRRTQSITCAFMCMTELLKSKERMFSPTLGRSALLTSRSDWRNDCRSVVYGVSTPLGGAVVVGFLPRVA